MLLLLLVMLLLLRAGDRGARAGRGGIAIVAIDVDDVDEENSNIPLSLPPLRALELHPPVKDDARDLRRSMWSESEGR